MMHRHLLPNEVDLLVDGDSGFGLAELRAHVTECDHCRERLDEARVVIDALESLPHFAPDSRLAERVMVQVPVFVPAHVAARDMAARWMPRSPATRLAAVAALSTTGGLITLALLWLASRGDAVLFMGGLATERLRTLVAGAARDLALAVLGDSAVSALQGSGVVGTSLLVFGFILTALATVAGVRRLALAGRRA